MYRTLSLLFLFVCVTGCGPSPQPPQPPPTSVTSFTVETQTLPLVWDYIGFAASSHPVEIRARVEGYLDKIAFKEGNIVNEGDLLFQLDPKQYEANVEQAKGEVAKQTAILENAKLTVQRLRPLYEQKAASKKDLDNAIASELSAEASLISAQAQLLFNEINLGYTTITSPITGLVDKSRYREGALINPGANSLLTTVSVVNPIWVYFTISENDILRFRKQMLEGKIVVPKNYDFDVEVELGEGITFPYVGKVNFSSPTYDQSTGTLLVRAVFPNPQSETNIEGFLLPGQFVRIKVYGATRPNTIVVPRRALLQKRNGMFVYMINKDNTVIAQDVEVAEWYGDYQIVTNGLKVGDRIVVDGINKIGPGFPVNVISEWRPEQKLPVTQGRTRGRTTAADVSKIGPELPVIFVGEIPASQESW